MILTITQEKILQSLAEFKFLTVTQFIKLGVSTQKTNLSNSLKPLVQTRRPFVGRMDFGVHPRTGRYEYMYYLKNRGKKLLMENGYSEHDIKIPKGTGVLFTSDYYHRKFTIDCHIQCMIESNSNGVDVIDFHRYFDKVGSQRQGGTLKAKTYIDYTSGYIISDASALLTKKEISRLYAIEVYNDKNTKRILEQLQKHRMGINQSALCENYNIKKGHRVLSIFTHEGIMESVRSKFNGGSDSNMFLFKSYNEVIKSFLLGWSDLDGITYSLIE